MPRRRKIGLEPTAFRQLLAERGVEPCLDLVRELRSAIPLTEQEIAHPGVSSLLASGYELTPLVPPVDDKTWCLRPNLKVRIQILETLATYAYPKYRTIQSHHEIDERIVVTVMQFGDHQPVKTISAAPRQAIDLPPEKPFQKYHDPVKRGEHIDHDAEA